LTQAQKLYRRLKLTRDELDSHLLLAAHLADKSHSDKSMIDSSKAAKQVE